MPVLPALSTNRAQQWHIACDAGLSVVAGVFCRHNASNIEMCQQICAPKQHKRLIIESEMKKTLWEAADKP
jgi:hypothetical protein